MQSEPFSPSEVGKVNQQFVRFWFGVGRIGGAVHEVMDDANFASYAEDFHGVAAQVFADGGDSVDSSMENFVMAK